MSSSFRRFCVGAAAALLVLAAASPALASYETLKRSMSNILFAPIDLALSPVTAAHAIYTNMMDIDDSLGVRIAYPIPGYAWTTGVFIGSAAIREITGVIELLPGLILLPFEADMDPLFAPAEKADAIVDLDTAPLNVKFGVNYTTVPY